MPRWPLSFHAYQLLRALPEFRGRDRLSSALLEWSDYPDAVMTGRFGGGLLWKGNPRRDRSLLRLASLRWARPALAPVLESVLRPGDTFLDLGAMIGLYTLWGARLVGPKGCVIACEPNPQSLAHLRSHVAVNGFEDRIDILPVAVGDGPGEVDLHVLERSPGLASRYLDARHEGTRTLRVERTTVDAIVADRGTPSLVKVDVEGMEPEVLAGAEKSLASSESVWVMELGPRMLSDAGSSTESVRSWLGGFGYELYDLLPRGLEEAGDPPRSSNVVAAHPDRHEAALRRMAMRRYPRGQSL